MATVITMSGQMPDPVHTILTAVHTLYYDPDPSAKKLADHTLKEFQRTTQAWQVHYLISFFIQNNLNVLSDLS